ncbi:RNA polymerase sigma factor [Streptomyces shenzhenensis]|uniref:RNA polymerase sigma factor n=1 Tax=Streptomyces shenzhenensis TaxID=943815 RepID=UPI0038D41274
MQRHAPALIRPAPRLLGTLAEAEAEGAVRDAFLSAWRRPPEFRGQASFDTWMYRIVTNRCLNVLRAARGPVAPLEAAGEVAAEHATSPVRVTEARDAVREPREALDPLAAEHVRAAAHAPALLRSLRQGTPAGRPARRSASSSRSPVPR